MENFKTIIRNGLYIPTFFTDLGLPLEFNVLFYVLVIDIISGVARSTFNNGIHTFSSKKLIAGLMSKIFILSLPASLSYVCKGIGLDFSFIVTGVYRILIVATFLSFLSNVQSIYKKQDLPESDVVIGLIGILTRFFLNILKTTKSQIENKEK